MARKRKYLDKVVRPPGEIVLALPEKFDGSLDAMAMLARSESESPHEVRCRLIELLRGETDMTKFVEVGERMAKAKTLGTLDTVAARAGINRSDAFGAICRVLHRFNFEISKTIISSVIASNAARVTEVMAASAATIEGQADRFLFMRVAGMGEGGKVPQNQFNLNVNAQANAAAGAKSGDGDASGPDARRPLPAFDVGIRRMASAIRALPAPSGE